MNKRIEDLKGKALDQAVPYTWHHLNQVQIDDVMNKLAELIVRECAQVLETNGDNQRTIRMTESTGHDKTTDWMEGYEEAVKQYGGFLLKKNAKQIKKHFGVE